MGAARVLAWVIWTVVLLLFISAFVMHLASDSGFGGADVVLVLIPLFIFIFSFACVGALIASRRTSNPLGWLCLTAAFAFALALAAFGYTEMGTSGDLPPGAPYAAWLAELGWTVGLIVPGTFILLLFPSGRLVGRRWRPIAIVAATGLVAEFMRSALAPGRLDATGRSVENPFGVSALEPALDLIGALATAAFVLSFLGSIASLLVRFRRGTLDERQQIKWLLYAGGLLPVAVVAGILLQAVYGPTELVNNISNALLSFGIAAIPLAIGIAILRHQLYDIDVIINRTLVYGVLTAALLGSYLLIVVGLGRLLDPVTQDSDLAVAAATLAVAALFRPLRARVQAFIDRRFYRGKYDAERALASFGARLRDQVAIEAVRGDVLAVVGTTLQPSHASLWLKGTRTS